MTVFAQKLDSLSQTVDLVLNWDVTSLSRSLRACAAAPVIAVASGGSAVSAQYFKLCRETLGHSITEIMTPMAYTLDMSPRFASSWLFSASGENADILGAADVARRLRKGRVDLLTVRPQNPIALDYQVARKPLCVHAPPVFDPKDGFLATHSVISAAAALLFAAGVHSPHPENQNQNLVAAVQKRLDLRQRQDLLTDLAGAAKRDVLLLLYDPHLAPLATLIETSCWEAGLLAVQATDYRNFAHGRHVGLERHLANTFVLALTTGRSLGIWKGIKQHLPPEVALAEFNFETGRQAAFLSLVEGLTFVEAFGVLKDVDPGKPGVPSYGRAIFEQTDLRVYGTAQSQPASRKVAAELVVDVPQEDRVDWERQMQSCLERLETARINAVVLDYDGTIVDTDDRTRPPRADILSGMIELLDNGIHLAIASGRGGSVGQMLREQLPDGYHDRVLIGYYNGGYVVPLSTDIEEVPPPQDHEILTVYDDLVSTPAIFKSDWLPKEGRQQIMIPLDKVRDLVRLEDQLAASFIRLSQAGKAMPRIVRSNHSMDIIPETTTKKNVVNAMVSTYGIDPSNILAIGDCGHWGGNDFDLLDGTLGLSVDRVCHRMESSWNLLSSELSGPDGLKHILNAVEVLDSGVAKMNTSNLYVSADRQKS